MRKQLALDGRVDLTLDGRRIVLDAQPQRIAVRLSLGAAWHLLRSRSLHDKCAASLDRIRPLLAQRIEFYLFGLRVRTI